ncbi:hypothetical protein LMH66_07975 [Shewanella sp. 10N.7]|uniref:Uncharacterized protein n=1 Tax=Shewanella electrodiphila TaxID=934143 RepID=A0ABT0KPB4_9GAMM|nr:MULTISPECIES: hypothetical protein [Shewanella]MCC4832566.1 hypothetical protein [Shewanella sp. 10N.7]MCL1045464.1 hypothetical protein [Shewanella electrodiphila]
MNIRIMNTRMKLVVMMSITAMLLSVSVSPVYAGKVVVRKASEPFDAFAVRDQVQQDHQWQEMLRMQQQIQILQALPVGCLPIAVPYRYFSCSGNAYRPYSYQDQELYIQIDEPSSQQVPRKPSQKP